MLYKLLLLTLVFSPIAVAETEPLPLDLIELLGELDEEDSAILDEAMQDISASSTSKPNTEQTKKSTKVGERQ